MSILDTLRGSDEPSIRYKTALTLEAKRPSEATLRKMREEIASSDRVKTLLSERDKTGRLPHHPYAKWRGAHWVLADLADLGYPPGDETLIPLREQVYEWLFSEAHQKRFLQINGLWRRCASQEGNAMYYLNTLRLADERTEELAMRLEGMQWPDGGWNCKKDKDAHVSSFMETITPLRGHIAHAKAHPKSTARDRVPQAAEIFLKRELFLRQADGSVIKPVFLKIRHPVYWHYDILFGLKVLNEGGMLGDKRCGKALDLLEDLRLENGGWAANGKFYQSRSADRSSCLVSWGSSGAKTLNEFVTVEALTVLKAAGRRAD